MAPNIEWKTPSGAPAPDDGEGSVEDTVSHLAPVRKAVHKKALSMGMEAQAALAAHRRRGKAEVVVDRHPRFGEGTPDWYVILRDDDPGGDGRAGKNLEDRSAMSIEFGHIQRSRFGKRLAVPHKVEGLHVLGNAMNRAIARYTGPQ